MSVSSGKQGQQRGRTLAAKRGDVRLLTIIVLTCFTLIWVLTRVYIITMTQQPDLSPASAMLGEGAISPSNLRAQDIEDLLPPGTTLLERLEADLNNDGEPEIVLAFNDAGDPDRSGMAGIAILVRDGDEYRKTWEVRPLSEGEAADVVVRDINMDGVLEVLLYKSTEDRAHHSLHIFAWDGADYLSITPHGGPLDGMEAFVSAYYPPDFADVDMDGSRELLAYEEQPAYERLEVLVYAWDGETLVYDNLYIVLGPPRPHRVEGQGDSTK